MILNFDDFELDTDRVELRRDGEPVHVEPKVFRLIAHFACNPDQVFSQDDLIAAVWGGRVVSDTTVASCIKHARKALGDTGQEQRLIKTVRGHGFRFVGAVRAPTATAGAAAAIGYANSVHSDPSLLVLPFRALSDDEGCAALGANLPASLGTVLARVPLLKISAQTFRHVSPAHYASVRDLHAEHGVDYVLDGSVHAAGGEVVINAQLADAKSGFALWTDKLTMPTTSAGLLDQAVLAIVPRVEPKLIRAIYDSVRSQGGAPNARSLYLEANGLLSLKGWHYKSFPVARDLLRRSRDLSPEFAHASGYLSFVLGLGHRLGILEERERVHDEALEAAERALELDSQDSAVLGLTGCALSDLGYSPRALPILQHAVDLNVTNAQAWTALGSVCLSQRRIDAAIEHLRHGMRISPLDTRLSVWGSVLSTALRLRGRLDEALVEAELACRREYNAYWPRVALATVRLCLGDRGGALAALNDAYRAKPDLSPEQIRYLVGRRHAGELLALMR